MYYPSRYLLALVVWHPYTHIYTEHTAKRRYPQISCRAREWWCLGVVYTVQNRPSRCALRSHLSGSIASSGLIDIFRGQLPIVRFAIRTARAQHVAAGSPLPAPHPHGPDALFGRRLPGAACSVPRDSLSAEISLPWATGDSGWTSIPFSIEFLAIQIDSIFSAESGGLGKDQKRFLLGFKNLRKLLTFDIIP